MAKDESGGRRNSNGTEASKMSFPELTGSDKQISWAKDIRESAAMSLDANVRNARANEKNGIKPDGYDGTVPSVEAAVQARDFVVENILSKVTSAKQYIDNRNKLSFGNLTKIANEIDRKLMKKK